MKQLKESYSAAKEKEFTPKSSKLVKGDNLLDLHKQVDQKRSRMASHEQWEVDVDLTPIGNSEGNGALLPRPGKLRPTPHTKTNECDH